MEMSMMQQCDVNWSNAIGGMVMVVVFRVF